jgi:hypothetical protein
VFEFSQSFRIFTMKLRAFLLSLTFGFSHSASAQVATLVDWNHGWAFLHPMGTLPNRPLTNDPDLDFTNTWFLAETDFLNLYDGAPFGSVPALTGTPAVVESYDSGTGPGPLGYGTIDYAATAGAEFTALGTALTLPTSNQRRTGYFRTLFTVPAGGLALPQLRYVLDDGGFIYLNGELLAVVNMGGGVADTYPALAANTTLTEGGIRTLNLAQTGAQENAVVVRAVPILPAGQHTLAVSVHNASVTSSDLALALQLQANSACTIVATRLGAPVRDEAGTPFDPSDDTFTFTALVDGTQVGGGWTSDGVPASGNYGDVVVFGPFPADNPYTITFTDDTAPGCTAQLTVTPPGCAMTLTSAVFHHEDNGTPADPADDTFTVDLLLAGQFTAATYTINQAPFSGTYGTPSTLGPFAVTNTASVLLFDDADPVCFLNLTLQPPRLLGESTLPGAVGTVAADGLVSATPSAWVANDTARTLTMSNAGSTNHQARGTTWFDLSGSTAPLRRVTALLTVTDTSTGSNFETEDQFRAVLEWFDGVTTHSVLLTQPYDRDANGFMTGYSGTTAEPYDSFRERDEFNRGGYAGNATFSDTFRLTHVMPASAQRARLLFIGANNGSTERYQIHAVLYDEPFCEIRTLAGAVQFNNQGDNDAANDTFSVPVVIDPVYTDTSTGWISDSIPASGQYADPQPVLFGPFPLAGGDQTITLQDAQGANCESVVVVTAPACALTLAVSNIVRVENGPGVADDTVQCTVVVNGNNTAVNWVSSGLVGLGAFGVPTVLTFPAGGTIAVTVSDAANAACTASQNITTPARYALGVVDLGQGAQEFGSALGLVPATQWVNNAVDRTLRLNNGGGATRVVQSQVVDLSGASGPVHFSAAFNARETSGSSNFEATDSFSFVLHVVAGGVTNVLNLITPYDVNTNGVMNGIAHNPYDPNLDELNGQRVGTGSQANFVYPLATNLPAGASAAWLVIGGRNDSASEHFTVSNLVFAVVSDPDGDQDGMDDAWEDLYLEGTAAEPDDDHDLDGMSNLEEFLAGTLPNQAASRLLAATPVVAGSAVSLTWDSVDGKTYQVEFTAEPLPTLDWQPLGSPVTATGPTTTLNGTLPNGQGGYLRVRLVLP